MALLGSDPALMMGAIGASAIGPLAKLAVGGTCTYHYLGACRHIFWEKNPQALAKDTITNSAYVLFGGTAVISAGLAFTSLPAKE